MTDAQLEFSKPKILSLVQQYRAKGRTDSAAFLIWYLENYYRLEAVEAIGAVSDQGGDKGADGILVNDNEQTVTVFQARIFDNDAKTVGDKPLRELVGTVAQFEAPEKVRSVIETGGDARIASLCKHFEVETKIADGYDLRGVFLCNAFIHKNGEDYLKTASYIEFVGQKSLKSRFISSDRERPIHDPAKFSIKGILPTKYEVEGTKTTIVPVRASELVGLSGIENQSLFHYNVRAPLGNTAVNRSIVKTIENPQEHKLFPLFHNGVTIIAKRVSARRGVLKIEDYFVVNGCQSITALFRNQDHITKDLRVLAKFIQIEPESELAAKITRFSNNQNGVSARDFKSNHRIQVRLQNEMQTHYANDYFYEIKRGERLPDGITVIPNQDAGLMLTAFDLKEPWATHRRYLVFEERHGVVFGNKMVTADRIVLCQVIYEALDEFMPKVENVLFAQYLITKYFLLYVIRLMLEKDALWPTMSSSPQTFVRAAHARRSFRKCLSTILTDLVVDLNAEVAQYKDDFDYRDKLRQEAWVNNLATTLVKEREKQINKGRTPTFKAEWEKLNVAVTLAASGGSA